MSTQQTILEIGPGRGDFLIHLATERPKVRFTAIEYKRKRYEKLLKRIKSLENITLHFGNVLNLLPERYPTESFDEVYILYPDPWPKRRHAKHRIIQQGFLLHLYRALKEDGRIVIATDDHAYHGQILNEFENLSLFRRQPAYPSLFPTFFSEKWLKMGRQLFAFEFRKQ